MPIDYQRDDRRRLITVTLTDPFSFDQLMSQTNRQWTEHTWESAVLYDSRGARQVTPASTGDSTPARVATAARCSEASTLMVFGTASVSRKESRPTGTLASRSGAGTASVLALPMRRSGGSSKRSPSARARAASTDFRGVAVRTPTFDEAFFPQLK